MALIPIRLQGLDPWMIRVDCRDLRRSKLAPRCLRQPGAPQVRAERLPCGQPCYIIYNSIDWPGISTAVTTCLLTALSTIGSSRQKQFLRFTGAIVGGFLSAWAAQIFILPYVDSIAGFTVLFVLVTAWRPGS